MNRTNNNLKHGLSPTDTNPEELRISVAIPVYNEESVLPELCRRLRDVLDGIPGQHESVFVDDGSIDATREILGGLAIADERVKAVLLSRNFGHQSALSAALDHVTGDAIVLMDGDLQDTPETIPRFLEQFKQGFDVVYAIREKRKESLLLKFCYASFYRVIHSLSDLALPEGSGDFAMLSRRVVDRMTAMPERHRYLRGLRYWVGYRQTGITVERDARHSGISKYSFSKLFQLAFDGIFSFSTKPLRAATLIGMVAIAGSVLFSLFSVIAHLFFSSSPQGFTTLITCLTLMTGIQLLFLGVIGEYVGRIYEQVKLRPMYVVDQILTAQNTDLDRIEVQRQTPASATANEKRTIFPAVKISPDTSSEFPIG